MRRLFSDKAGATFNANMPSTTICVRKDCVELVSKGDKGAYVIMNVVPAGNGQMMIIANWGCFFDRMQNPAVQLPRCKATRPTLYKLLTNSLDGITLARKEGENEYSVFPFGSDGGYYSPFVHHQGGA